MTSLAYSSTMEKALVKIIFCRKILICQPIFKIVVALYIRLLGCKLIVRLNFAGGISGQGDMQKGSVQICCKESVGVVNYAPTHTHTNIIGTKRLLGFRIGQIETF